MYGDVTSGGAAQRLEGADALGAFDIPNLDRAVRTRAKTDDAARNYNDRLAAVASRDVQHN